MWSRLHECGKLPSERGVRQGVMDAKLIMACSYLSKRVWSFSLPAHPTGDAGTGDKLLLLCRLCENAGLTQFVPYCRRSLGKTLSGWVIGKESSWQNLYFPRGVRNIWTKRTFCKSSLSFIPISKYRLRRDCDCVEGWVRFREFWQLASSQQWILNNNKPYHWLVWSIAEKTIY